MDLPCGRVALFDEGDYETIAPYRWCASTTSTSTTFYAKARVTHPKVASHMHRVILCFPLLNVDHINQNGLDNRRCNLRLVTHQQNCLNIRMRANKTSQYRGVSKNRHNTWTVQFRNNIRRVNGGSYKTEVEAALAYDRIVREIRGEFAILNFPELV